jgi:hypothetical protein
MTSPGLCIAILGLGERKKLTRVGFSVRNRDSINPHGEVHDYIYPPRNFPTALTVRAPGPRCIRDFPEN